MKIPKIINKGKHKYKFIKRCNKNTFLYQNVKYGYKQCFSLWELGHKTKQIEDKKVKVGYHL